MEYARLRPTWVEVDLDAIAHNVSELRRLAPDSQVMAVVKADGYGHGAQAVARTALEAGATWLGVATVEEGVDLRRVGIVAPTLIFGYVPVEQTGMVLLHGLRPAVFSLDLARALEERGAGLKRQARIHLKIDTGMGRVGVRLHELAEFVRQLRAFPHLEVEGVFTHLATADEPENPFAQEQLAEFEEALHLLRDMGINPPVIHAAASAATMLLPNSHYDLVRAGIAMYGLPPDPALTWPANLRPALTWRTKVGLVKEIRTGQTVSYGCTYRAERSERIASLPVGYADGFPRHLSNKGEVLIQGRRCPVVGRVCMDQTMVRLPDDVTVSPGDEVVLIGRQGNEVITASDIAQTTGTINYEVVCGISKRVPRLYRQDGRVQS
ncbi:MAG TPA: alanine racemase [Symbiobacteriaceae bacterium]|jgi:alanine racemase|nr:alanine racemase [Symbiobacteriaceae bacterium]